MKKLIILFSILIFGSCVFASEFNVHKLDSGHTVIIKQVSSNPIVILDTWVKTGSVDESDNNSGVAHFLEHLFFKGTQKHPAGEFDRILESKGAIINAATSKDFTHYYIKIPSEHFDLALELHSDMLLNPQIPRKELEKERKVVLEEIAKDKNSPANITYDKLNELMYKSHPYKRKVIGRSDVIEKITREEILDFYNAHYAPSNMVTVVVGDVNPNEVVEKVKKAFNTTPRKIVKNQFRNEKPLSHPIVEEIYYPTETGYLLMGFRGGDINNKDSVALDVLAAILGDGATSKLYQNVKNQKQLAYSISASNLTYKHDGLFFINANFIPAQKDKLTTAIFGEIKDIQQHGVTDSELNIAKSIIERDTYYSRESVSNIASEMGYVVTLTDNPDEYDNYLENIKKVTAADVKRVACKYLGLRNYAMVMTLPNNQKPTSPAQLEKPKPVYNGKLVKSTYNTNKYTLENGAILLANSNKQNDIVAMMIIAKGGEFIEKVKGTANLTAEAMYKGTKNYSAQELVNLLEENGIKISSAASSDYFVVDVLTTKQQLSKTMHLLNEIINNSSFDDYEVEKVRTTMINQIKENRDVPLNLALEEYRTHIFEGSVYSNSSKIIEKSLPKVGIKDIKTYYKTIFAPQNVVISVNGDVDDKYLINEFTEMFNQKSGEKFVYSSYASQIKPVAKQEKYTNNVKDLRTAWLFLGWQVSGNTDIKEFVTLQLIDTILGSGMSSRLFKSLREQEGLAYQIGTEYLPYILKGSFTVYVGTNPLSLARSKQKILNEIELLKTEYVKDTELQEAKDQLLGKYVLNLETNLAKASALASYEASGRGFDFVNEYKKIVKSITSSDILAVANKYFGNNYVESVVDVKK